MKLKREKINLDPELDKDGKPSFKSSLKNAFSDKIMRQATLMKEQKIKEEIEKVRSENVRSLSKEKALQTHDGTNKDKSFPEKLV